MTPKIFKYNPAFLSDQELVESFVVRHATLDLILEVIQDNTHETNQHLLVLGPRGSGKTSLLRRVAVAVGQTPELGDRWFPLSFGEEVYEVTSAGEFWLEAIHYLGLQTGDSNWGRVYDELLQEPDERRLEQRCLARLLDFADSRGKRLLLLVENLNLMIGEQLDDDDAWSLRHTLMHESRLMLLGSATSSFDAITDQNKPMFELFRLIELSPLSVEECQKVWLRAAGQEISEKEARGYYILTGGNPRLLTILAVFGANRSFSSLFNELSLLVDEHTDYFKSNFENLPPQERKVFACLATLWEDSLAGDVARATRLTTSQVSALLRRLEGRGVVRSIAVKGGKKRYQLAERLYNIYYLMRRGRDRVRAVVLFMRQFYGQERLPEAVGLIAREACGLGEGKRQKHYWAIKMLCGSSEAREKWEDIRRELPPEFLQLSDIPDDLKRIAATGDDQPSPEIKVLRGEVKKAVEDARWEDAVSALHKVLEHKPDSTGWALLGSILSGEHDQTEEGIVCLRKAVELDPKNAWAWANLGVAMIAKLDQPEEGVACLRKVLEIDPEDGWAWGRLGVVLVDMLDQSEEGVVCLRKAVELDPEDDWVWGRLGAALIDKLDQPEEGVVCLRKAVELNPKEAKSWVSLGAAMIDELDQPEEGVACLRKAVEFAPEKAWIWAILGTVMVNKLDQPEAGVACLRKAIDLDPKDARAWGHLGASLIDDSDQPEEGIACLRKAVELDPDDDWALVLLGDALVDKLDQPEEGVVCLRKAVELDPEDDWAWALLGDALIEKLDQPEEGVVCLRKAVELDPEDDWVWGRLGAALIDKLGQPEEGVACLREALELDPEDDWAWASLGAALVGLLDQPEEGVACLRRAVELDPTSAWSWGRLGTALIDKLDQSEEGIACLRKAVELDPEDAITWAILGSVLIIDLEKSVEGLVCLDRAAALDSSVVDNPVLENRIQTGRVSMATLEAILERTGRPADLLHSVACCLMDSENYQNLEAIEAWAREAVEKDEADPNYHGALARALALRGAIPEALAQAAIILEHPDIIRRDIQEPTDILTSAAALGFGREALDMLLASPSLDVLEPVAVGLKQYLGLDVHAPQEVKEIGEDIVKRIEYWKEWHTKSKTHPKKI